MQQFGEDFGQKVDLTASIRNILRNYPEGTAIFKELIQNADDAGARTVRFCLDNRQHRSEKLAHSSLEQFQGPALLIYNDAMFTKEDFQSIQRIGDSLKNLSDESKTKIGRFGIGFNSTYHWSDLPGFISDRYLVMLDPQARFLPNVNPANPGKIVDWLTNKTMLETFADQFSPYSIPEVNWSVPFNGTLFRLPLRTEQQSATSMLSKRWVTSDQVFEVLQSLVGEASTVLLFLRNVEKIEIDVWHVDQPAPQRMHSCEIKNVDKSMRMMRSYDDVLGKNRGTAVATKQQDYLLHIEIIDTARNTHRTEHWEICTQFGGGDASKLSNDPKNVHLKLVPLGGVAGNIFSSDALNTQGSAYCFLPLPITTGLPVMVNGFFELSSNRRDIWQESVDMTGDGSTRANWNKFLLRDVIAPCYARMLCKLKEKMGFSEFFQSLWPKWNLPQPWSILGNSTLFSLVNQQLLQVDAARPVWIDPKNAVILPLTVTSNEDKAELSRLLRWLGVPLVSFTVESLHESLVVSKICARLATPTFVRELLRQVAVKMDPSLSNFSLAYCMSDLKPYHPGSELNHLELLPMKNGEVLKLRTFSKAQKQSLDSLTAMGFPVQDALAALLRCNFNVGQSSEFLTSAEASGDAQWRKGSLCVITASHDDLAVFERAFGMIIDQGLLGAKEVETLCHPDFQLLSNIRLFGPSLIPDILTHILPAVCFEKKAVKLTSMSATEQAAVEDFIPRLWQYIDSNPKTLAPLCEGAAVLFATDEFAANLCPLSRLSNIICPVKGDAVLPAAVVDVLGVLNIRTLDISRTPCDVTLLPNIFWSYVHPPTFEGLASSIAFALREEQDLLSDRGSRMTTTHKDGLREFFAARAPPDISEDMRMVLTLLPIFKLANGPPSEPAKYTALGARYDKFAAVQEAHTLPSVLLPSHIIGYSSAQELRLLAMLKVPVMTALEFHRRFFLPNLQALYAKFPAEVEQALLTLLVSLRNLRQEDKSFVEFMKNTACVPNGQQEIKKIGELFDPSDSDIFSLMGDALLPHINFRAEEVKVVLRQLGMHTTIDLQSIIVCAQAIETMDDVKQAEQKLTKAKSLFRYLDRNISKLTGEEQSRQNSGGFGFFANITQLFSDKSASKEDVAVFRTNLQRISWMPALVDVPLIFLPWAAPSDGKLSVCAAPNAAAHSKDIWYCSSTLRIVDEVMASTILPTVLGWTKISLQTMAKQLRDLSLSFSAHKQTLDANDLNQFRQLISDHAPHFYQKFELGSESDRNAVFLILESVPWIWIGSDFVHTSKVALQSAINAAPYLHQLPENMKMYERLVSTFRIKETFRGRDFLGALCEMAIDCGCISSPQLTSVSATTTTGILSDSQLDIAISLVVLLASEAASVLHAQTIFVPDVNGRLAPAADLVNDDVPWLAGQEFLTLRASCRMVHSKISSAVAEKLGVKSLRLSLVKKNLEQNLFAASATGVNIESFGQAESLTNRLKTILDLYPDGSPILNELIQNADDAGATVVRIMVDENHYPSESLMDSRMEALQGPALVIQNDSKFTEADFRNLASVGQGSKLEKLGTTGRFGLGFNSTYHLTDTPVFVSGDYFVFFDPHCTHIPGATTSQPGIRIRYTNSDLHRAFANQFEPFRFHGFDFSKPYAGTMFRFPLRSINQAKRSEICKRSYQLTDVHEMVEQIVKQLANVLIFLRSVKRIELYKCAAGSNEPILMHTAAIVTSHKTTMNDQSLMAYFEPGASANVANSKDGFYAKLMSTPDDKLPWSSCSKQVVVENFLAPGASKPDGVAVLPRIETVDYEIVQGICGKNAKRLASQEAARYLKLVPFGSVAACVGRSISSLSSQSAKKVEFLPAVEGQLFCFLPLPIKTALPVHINAYWELSSNRRDIWRGEDTKGEAKLRSDWNMCLMKDVLSELYSKLLVRVNHIISARNDPLSAGKIFDLLPCPIPPQPWNAIAEAVYPAIKDYPLLWSKIASGKYVTPREAFLLEVPSVVVAEYSWMEDLMLEEGISVVLVSSNLLSSFVKMGCVGGVINPDFVRKHFRQSKSSHPCLMANVTHLEANDYHLIRAAKLLLYCFSDLTQSAGFEALHGVQLLPLGNHTLGVLASPMDGVIYYSASDIESRLLTKCSERLVAADAVIGSDLHRLLEGKPFSEVCNVHQIEAIDMLKLVCSALPKVWLSADTVAVDKSAVISQEWLGLMWTYILDNHLMELFYDVFPIVPVLAVSSRELGLPIRNLARMVQTVPIIPPVISAVVSDHVIAGLAEINIFVLDSKEMQAFIHNQAFGKLLTPPGAAGLLVALEMVYVNGALKNADHWPTTVRSAVHEFILDEVLHNVQSLNAKQQSVLRSMPIWSHHGSDESCFGNLLAEQVCLPPLEISPKILNPHFLKLRADRDRGAYLKLGVPECTLGQFFADFVIDDLQANKFQLTEVQWIGKFVLENLSRLESDRAGISSRIGNCSLFTIDGNNSIYPATSLYDPDIPMLQSFLPPSFFPAAAVRSNPLQLYAMKQLGLRKEVTCSDILCAAKAIQDQVDANLAKFSLENFAKWQASVEYRSLAEKSFTLLRYLINHIERLLQEVDPASLAAEEYCEGNGVADSLSSNTHSFAGGDWGVELRSLTWIVVLVNSPSQHQHAGLPWPTRIHSSPFAAAVQCTILRNAWFASATTRICAEDVSKPLLLSVLGWHHPIPGRGIALQLMSMCDEANKVLHATGGQPACQPAVNLMQSYDEVFPSVIARLHHAYEQESSSEKSMWLKVLVGKSVLWMSNGRFVEPYRVAFHGLMNIDTEPFLFVIPPYLLKYKNLLLDIGVKDNFTAMDLAALTRENYAVYKEAALPHDKVMVIVGIAQLLHRLFKQESTAGGPEASSDAVRAEDARLQALGAVYLPNSRGILAPAHTLTFNDAPWIVSSLGARLDKIDMFHDRVDSSVAQGLGGRSLRELLFAGEDMVCPPVDVISKTVASTTLMGAVNDLVHLADVLGGKSVQILFDECSYPTESLLHPGLSAAQGPALIMHIDGIRLSHEDVSRSFVSAAVPSTGTDAPSNFCIASGRKLLSSFAIADCLQILSGNELFVFDPCGEHLVGEYMLPSSQSFEQPPLEVNAVGTVGIQEGSVCKARRFRVDRRLTIAKSGTISGVDDQDNLLVSFADQFAPFLSLPADAIGGFAREKCVSGVIIRMPLRTKESMVSSMVLSVESLKHAFGSYRSCMTASILFAMSLTSIRLSHISTTKHCEIDMEINLLSDRSIRSQRLKMLQSTGWEKQGLNKMFSKMLSNGYSPPELSHPVRLCFKLNTLPWFKPNSVLQNVLDTFVQNSSDQCSLPAAVTLEETWIVSSCMGHSPLRDVALTEPYRSANLLPFVSLAMQVLESWQLSKHEVPPDVGMFVCGAGVMGATGLPFHVEGQFIETDKKLGSPSMKEQRNSQSIPANSNSSKILLTWNASIIGTALERLYPVALVSIMKRLLSEPGIANNMVFEGMYKYWIYLPMLTTFGRKAFDSARLGSFFTSESLFLSSANALLPMDKLLLNAVPFPSEVLSYLSSTTPLARCPSQLAVDLMTLGLPVADLTPGRLRSYLKKDAHLHLQKLTRVLNGAGGIFGHSLLLELLNFVLSDLSNLNNEGEFAKRKAYRALQGCPLLLMADNTVRLFPVLSQDQVAFVENACYYHILPPAVLNRIVHPLLMERFPMLRDAIFQDTMFVNEFNPRFIKAVLSSLFPSQWAGLTAVIWPHCLGNFRDMELFLYLLWNDSIGKEGFDNLMQLKDYALLPVVSNERRVLLSIPCLPHVLISSPSRTSDDHRRELQNEVKMKQLLPIRAGTKANTEFQRADSWQWTRLCVEDASLNAVTVDVVRNESDQLQRRGEGQGTTNIAVAVHNAEVGFSVADESMPATMNNMLKLETFNVLNKAGFPFLDASLLEGTPRGINGSNSFHSADHIGKRIVDLAHHYLLSNVLVHEGVSTTGDGYQPLIRLDALTVAERNMLLTEVFDAHTFSPFGESMVEKLKALPLFTNSANSAAVSLAECSSQGVFWCEDRTVLDIINGPSAVDAQTMATVAAGTVDATTAVATEVNKPVILINHSSLKEIYRWLQVVELTAAVAMNKFVVPTIDAMDSAARLCLLQQLSRKWDTYRADLALVNALKAKHFIPMWSIRDKEQWNNRVVPAIECSTLLRRINELISWTNNELHDTLQGDALPNYFAPPGMQLAGNHVMFSDLGMMQELDIDMLIKIATDIQLDAQQVRSRWSAVDPDRRLLRPCIERGRSIIRYILSNDRMLNMFNNNHIMLRKLGQIRFVPLLQPGTIEEGGYLAYLEDVGSFNEFVAKNYGALAFSIMPILDEDLTPPMLLFSHLGIVHQASEEVVMRHLRQLISCKTLDRWNVLFSIPHTFNALLSYLHDRWNNLPPSIKSTLMTTSFIPIGHILVPPNRIFFRLTEDLAPFMHELPRHFGAHETLLKQLKVKETPTASDYVQFLQEISSEMGDCPLNPNELRAINTIVHTIVPELIQQSTCPSLAGGASMTTAQRLKAIPQSDRKRLESLKQQVFVPDENSVMRNLSKCIINDDNVLRRKVVQGVREFNYCILHPWLENAFASDFLLLKLSEVVIERVDSRGGSTVLVNDATVWQERIAALLQQPNIAAFLERLRSSQNSKTFQVIDDATVSDLPLMSALLEGLQVRFASQLITMCVLVDPTDKKELIVLDNSSGPDRSDCVSVFLEKAEVSVHGAHPTLFINVNEISESKSLEFLLAVGLCQYLLLGKHLIFTVAQYITQSSQSHQRFIEELLELDGNNGIDAVNLHRGTPGKELLPVDYDLIELKPFRSFRIGEIVACESSQIQSSGISGVATNNVKVLLYGKIVAVGEPNEAGLRKVDVKVAQTVARLLSTQVYSFKSAGMSTSGNRKVAADNAAILSSVPSTVRETTVGKGNTLVVVGEAGVATATADRVGPEEVLSAVEGLLRRAGLPLQLDQHTLMARVLELETMQRQADEALKVERLQATQGKQRMAANMQRFLCSICLEGNIQRSLVPCGHSFCESCCNQFPRNKCPVCRANIQSKLKLFLGDGSS